MYELVFWNYQDGIYLNNHLVYEAILEKQHIEGLEALPTVIIINRIASLFSTWERVDENSWKNNNGPGAFHVSTTSHSIKIDCYGTEGKAMDIMVNALEEFKCPLYDPQVPERYDGI